MTKLHKCLLALSLSLFVTNFYGMDIEPSTTPLIEAVKNYQERKVQKLLTKNVDVNAQDESGNTALFWAAKRGNFALCKMLLVHGAHVDLANKHKQTPLHAAAMSGNIDAVSLLIDRGANVNARDSYRGRTPLHWVVRMTEGSVKKEGQQMSVENATEIIKLLLSRGANPMIQDLERHIPLAWAKEYRLEPIIVVLTEASRVPSPPLKQAPQLQVKKEKKRKSSRAKKAAKSSHTIAVSPVSQTYSKIKSDPEKGQKTVLKKALRAQGSVLPSNPVAPMESSKLPASQEIIVPEPNVPVVVEPIVPQVSTTMAPIKEEAPKSAAVSPKTEPQAPAIVPTIKPTTPEQVRSEYESSEDDDYDDAPESSSYKFYFNTFPGTD
jgi:hypothetical protein